MGKVPPQAWVTGQPQSQLGAHAQLCMQAFWLPAPRAKIHPMASEDPSASAPPSPPPALFSPEQQLWLEQFVAARSLPAGHDPPAISTSTTPAPATHPPRTAPGNIGEPPPPLFSIAHPRTCSSWGSCVLGRAGGEGRLPRPPLPLGGATRGSGHSVIPVVAALSWACCPALRRPRRRRCSMAGMLPSSASAS